MKNIKIKITQEIIDDNKELRDWEVGDIVSFEIPDNISNNASINGGEGDGTEHPPTPPIHL